MAADALKEAKTLIRIRSVPSLARWYASTARRLQATRRGPSGRQAHSRQQTGRKAHSRPSLPLSEGR